MNDKLVKPILHPLEVFHHIGWVVCGLRKEVAWDGWKKEKREGKDEIWIEI